MNLEISIFSGCGDSPLRAFVIQNRRPAQALSACLDRDLLISSPNCFASGHAYRFKSCPKNITIEKENTIHQNGVSFSLVAGTVHCALLLYKTALPRDIKLYR